MPAASASDGSHYEKRGKGEPVCIDDEIPFEIPESWEWARIETVSTDPRYGTSAKSKKTGAFPVLRMGNITKDGGLDYSNLVFTSDENEIETYRLLPGAVIFNRTNSREWVGKTAYYDGSVPAAYAGYLIAFYPILLSGEYVNYAMCTPYERDWCKRVKSDGINQSNINSQKLKSFLLPVPPREEQNRIVNLINEVMPYISQYDALEDARGHLDAELPDRLRKSILQMAVQGKLVEQNQDDEPASALLERIRKERAALVKARKLKAPKGGESVIYRASDGGYYEKRGKDEPVCIDVEIPFDIPESWAWVRLPEIADLRIGKTPSRHDERYWTNGNHPWFSISDMHDAETVRQSKEAITDKAMSDCFKAGASPAGTLLMSFKLTIGKTSILGVDAVHNEAIVSVLPHLDNENALRDYLLYALPFAAQNGDFRGAIKGSTLNSKSLSKLLIPLPPPQEQRRIVNALAELLPELTNQ